MISRHFLVRICCIGTTNFVLSKQTSSICLSTLFCLKTSYETRLIFYLTGQCTDWELPCCYCLGHKRWVLSSTGTVLLNFLKVSVAISHKLHDLVRILVTLPSEVSDVNVITHDPRMVQHFLNWRSFRGIFLEQLGYEILCFRTHWWPNLMFEVDFLINGLACNLFVIRTVERQVTAKHQVNYYPNRPQVHTLVICLLEQDLRSNIAKCPVRFLACLTGPKRLWKTKVHKFNFGFFTLVLH